MPRPQVSLAMMVKNEERFIEDALVSAQPWVDEMFVLDTGSTDRTVDIARSCGARVEHFPWCDDFARARNETLERARGDWVLILDADERIRGHDTETFREALQSGPKGPLETYLVRTVDVDQSGIALGATYIPRVFPRSPSLRYVGRVHNQLKSTDINHPVYKGTYLETFDILHLGFDPVIAGERQKAQRTIRLAEAALKEDPRDHSMRFFYARALTEAQRFEEAFDVLKTAVQGMTEAPDKYSLFGAACAELVKTSRLARQPIQVTSRIAREALERFPASADLWFEIGEALLEAEMPEEALGYFRKARSCLESPETEDPGPLHCKPWQLEEKIGNALTALGQYEEAHTALVRSLEAEPRRPSNALVDAIETVARHRAAEKEQPNAENY